MTKPAPKEGCPCGRQQPFNRCCGRFISGEELPETAEQLMRSRYTAYALNELEYVASTWHPRTRQAFSTDPTPATPKWLGLKVKRCAAGQANDETGMVEFVARFRIDGRGHRLHETSNFSRDNGRWFYVDGKTKP